MGILSVTISGRSVPQDSATPQLRKASTRMRNPRSGFFGPVLLGGILVVGLLFVAGIVSFKLNPFKTEHKDHSPPPILTELREMTDLHAAQAEFEVVIDDEEDVKYIPQVLAGERVQFVAVGTVDAVVDLSTLPAGAIDYDPDDELRRS